MPESIQDIVREMQATKYGDENCSVKWCLSRWADRIEAAWKAEAAEIVQIVQDAIVSYESAYPEAPNDDAEFYIKHQIDVANDWLAAHGFARVNVKLDKEEEPCL